MSLHTHVFNYTHAGECAVEGVGDTVVTGAIYGAHTAARSDGAAVS